MDKETSTALEETEQRLQDFCYYLVSLLEAKLQFYLTILEEQRTTDQKNTKFVSTASSIFNAIPYIGKILGEGLKECELFYLDRMDKTHAKTMANIVYYYKDNSKQFRTMLIDASLEIFFCFESPFVNVNCNGNTRRAMRKLAFDAEERIFNYLLQQKITKMISKKDICEGVLLGHSSKDKFARKKGKTVDSAESEKLQWKTVNIFTKLGLHVENKFFKNEKSKTAEYGYRKIFEWENLLDIIREWNIEDCQKPFNYLLTREKLPEYHQKISEYLSKNHETVTHNDNQHNELMSILEKFKDTIADLCTMYEETKRHNQCCFRQIEAHHLHQEEKLEELNDRIANINTNIEPLGMLHDSARGIVEMIESFTKQKDKVQAASGQAIEVICDIAERKISDIFYNNSTLRNLKEASEEIVTHLEDENFLGAIQTFQKVAEDITNTLETK